MNRWNGGATEDRAAGPCRARNGGGHPPCQFTISGNRVFDGYYLQAEELVFKKDAVLTFSKAALGIQNNLFVVAKEIFSEDPAAPRNDHVRACV